MGSPSEPFQGPIGQTNYDERLVFPFKLETRSETEIRDRSGGRKHPL